MKSVIERALYAWCARHGGVVSRREAHALEISDAGLSRLVARGLLVRLHAGVYALAALPTGHERDIRAAVLAVGQGSIASHRSAAWLQGLTTRSPAQPHLTLAAGRGARVRGVVVHRTRSFPSIVRVRAIPCTEPIRTLIDLSTELTPAQVDAAVDRALAVRLVRMADLIEALWVPDRGPNGRPALRRSLERRGYAGAPAPSVLESRMLRLLAQAGLPPPKCEVAWGVEREYRLDFAYPDRRLAIEVDGYVWHASPDRKTRDHERLNALQQRGWRVLVYTWKQVTDDSEGVIKQVLDAYRALAPAS